MIPVLSMLIAFAPLPPVGVFTEDVVERIQSGRRTTGLMAHRTVHGSWEYRFTSAKNLRVFRANPARYAVQLGGACGRMGELSGVGRPELSSVVNDRLYIFASPGCQRAFVKAPMRFLEQDEWLSQGLGDPRAMTLRERILAWAGGRAPWQHPAPFTVRTDDPITLSDTAYVHRTTHAFGTHESYFALDQWNDTTFAHQLRASSGEFLRNGKVERVADASQIRAILRERDRSYWHALHVMADPEALIAAGPTRDSLRIQMKGHIVTVVADEATGAVKALAYVGRWGGSAIADVRVEYGAFTEWNERKLPTSWTVSVNGKPVPEARVANAEYQAGFTDISIR
jgi:YHS domain-containing protein